MHHHLDVVRLAPAGDLPGLGKAAHDAQIDARVVDPLVLDHLAEPPLAAELLARRQRHPGARAQGLERIGVLAAQRVLDEIGPELLGLGAQPQRVGQIQPGVHIKGQLDLVADGLAHRLDLLDRGRHCAARLKQLALAGQPPAHKLPALGLGLEARIDDRPAHPCGARSCAGSTPLCRAPGRPTTRRSARPAPCP